MSWFVVCVALQMASMRCRVMADWEHRAQCSRYYKNGPHSFQKRAGNGKRYSLCSRIFCCSLLLQQMNGYFAWTSSVCPAVQSIYHTRCLWKARKITEDYSHPGHGWFTLLPVTGASRHGQAGFPPRPSGFSTSNTNVIDHFTCTL